MEGNICTELGAVPRRERELASHFPPSEEPVSISGNVALEDGSSAKCHWIVWYECEFGPNESHREI